MAMSNLQREEQIRYENYLDDLLYKAMEALRTPEKLGLNLNGEFVRLFPNPVFAGNHIKKIEYKPTQAVQLPDELFERLCILEDEIDSHAPKAKKDKPTKERKTAKYNPEDIVKWIEMREKGFSYGQIAKQFGANQSTVSNYIRKHYKRIGTVAN
ncbi:hypothetical protein ACQKFG_05670 [Peribacillus sp. NPDC076916]|uniref:hypothetical protein n=1 Tax=Peribacillus sp. NPDC076916 TaxID=3390608 RepID=UPI003CFC8E15